MNSETDGLCCDLNTLGAWLAFDDYSAITPLSDLKLAGPAPVIVLLGNQVIATLSAACRLAQATPEAPLLFSGGIGHATHFLYENLAASEFAPLVGDETLTANMAEAELYAAVAQRAFSISPGRILVESRSTNGGENARFSLDLLQQQGLVEAPVILLQDPLMQRRSSLTWLFEAHSRKTKICEEETPSGQNGRSQSPGIRSHAAFHPRVEPGPDNLPQLMPPHDHASWTFPRYLGLLLGEIARLHDDEKGYGPRGKNFIPHVDIPVVVWESYQRVLASPLAGIASR